MKSKKGYLPEGSIYPFRGLNTLDPSLQANPQTSPSMQNMEILRGALSKRKGYSFQGDVFADPVLGVSEFEDIQGTKHQLAFTTRKQFKWSGSSWTDVSCTTNVWTGNLRNPIEITPVAGLDNGATYVKWVLITNGLDTPKYWDGLTARFADYTPTGITNFKTFRTAAFFYDHLLLGNVTLTTGSSQNNIVYWTDTTSLVDFSGVNGGVVLLSDIQGGIQRFVQLGDRLSIYAEDSISAMTYVGGSQIYIFEKIVENTRLVSLRGIVNVSGFHLYLNQDNIIFFDGSKLLQVVGDQIMRTYREELYVNDRVFAFAFHDFPKRRVYFNIPTGPSTSKVYVMEYDLADKNNAVFTSYIYHDQPTAMGSFSRDVTLTYDSSVLAGVTYDQCNFTYNQGTVKGGFPLRVFGTEAGHICVCDDLFASDAGEAIEAYYDTIDLTVPQDYQSVLARWIEVEIDVRGFEGSVFYSVNQGRSFVFVQDLELTSDWQKITIPIDVMTKQIRFRFSNNCVDSKYEQRWVRAWFRPGGPS